VSHPEERLLAASMVDRSYERRMIVGERENTLASEVKGEGCQLGARQKGYLKVKGEKETGSTRENTNLRKIPG